MKCHDCRWWVRVQQVEGLGKCHRFPPTFTATEFCVFPLTGEIDHCGEWTPMTMRQVNEKASQDTPTADA